MLFILNILFQSDFRSALWIASPEGFTVFVLFSRSLRNPLRVGANPFSKLEPCTGGLLRDDWVVAALLAIALSLGEGFS